MVAVPTETAVTNPVALTVATKLLLLLHVTAWLLALAGAIVAVSCWVALTVRDAAVGFRITPVTAIELTEILQVAVKLPSWVVTVMVAVPTEMAVTNPLAFTVATAVLLLLQLTVLLLAFAGATVGVSCCVAFMKRLAAVGFSVTPVTATGMAVMTQVAVLAPSCVVAVIVAVPAVIAVTNPLVLTVATALLLLLQVIAWLLALAGAMLAVNCCVVFIGMVADAGVTVTPVTGIELTVILQVAVLFPSWVVTVMIEAPGETAVTNPLVLKVATALLLLLQVMAWLLALAGAMVAVNCCVVFIGMVADAGATVTPVTAMADETTSVAACKVTLPVPEACTHFTVSNLPAEAAL